MAQSRPVKGRLIATCRGLTVDVSIAHTPERRLMESARGREREGESEGKNIVRLPSMTAEQCGRESIRRICFSAQLWAPSLSLVLPLRCGTSDSSAQVSINAADTQLS